VSARSRGCDGINERGEPCGATLMRGSSYCFFHSPETRDEAAEARRLGGQRRKREGAVTGAYEIDGIATIAQLERVLEIAIVDTLALENSVPRNRTLGSLVQTALRRIEVGELETRLELIEATLKPRTANRRA
jgi:hypothetical protein